MDSPDPSGGHSRHPHRRVEDADLGSVAYFNEIQQRTQDRHRERVAQHREQTGDRESMPAAPIIIRDDEDDEEDVDATVKKGMDDDIAQNFDIAENLDIDDSNVENSEDDDSDINMNDAEFDSDDPNDLDFDINNLDIDIDDPHSVDVSDTFPDASSDDFSDASLDGSSNGSSDDAPGVVAGTHAGARSPTRDSAHAGARSRTHAGAHASARSRTHAGGHASADLSIRNPPVAIEERVSSYKLRSSNIIIRIGDFIETGHQHDSLYNGRFMLVKLIYVGSCGQVIFRGIPYTRTRNLCGMVEALRNELVEIMDIDENDDRDWDEQAQVQVAADTVERKRDFRVTNTQWPEKATQRILFNGNLDFIETYGPVVCRWRMVTHYRTAALRQVKRAIGRTLYHLREDDLDDPLYAHLPIMNRPRVPEETKLNSWRGAKARGGSYNNGSIGHGEIDLDEDAAAREQPFEVAKGQKYTFADIFCGAGGASCGARAAGVKVHMACDIDERSAETYRMNFPETTMHLRNVSELIGDMRVKDQRIDMLHISPPCQFWSPAHTSPGQDDNANRDILCSAHDIINKFRPRIVTVEQTYGILYGRHMQAFHQLLLCFTSQGYSITWRYIVLADWMVPQPRKRLVMVASCPGDFHPVLPEPCPVPPTVNCVLSENIHPDSTHNDPNQLNISSRYPRPPWNGNGILRNSLTCNCNDSKNYHPSGLRPFTVREYAALQTFPGDYWFVPVVSHAKKQVGNAFPPIAVEYLYGHLLEQLREEDNVFLPGEDGEGDEDDE
ncbi:S-adenosyl-L-methionine-dependent methyltransferase [Truncatella angustata]|uniref:DNA (cytosine-5-)-methyltransferase n=1 Tax=Truncatella angustata TaxID=152316 RepID=A0A9P8REV3_9PEZI|nr:S-adenosyl-L-methionine-dependent methyltransferase [Truncatella angustata]KAH6643308.1 S-adenosyl-L-methionine-dependent methyltransferase [Truncatella angustata]